VPTSSPCAYDSTRTPGSSLTARERSLVSLVGDVCTQALGDGFAAHLRSAREAGVSRRDLKESLLHLVVYASFPKVLCALRELRTVLDRSETGERDGERDGEHAEPADAATPPPEVNLFAQPWVRATLDGIDGTFSEIAMRFGGEVWGRGGVTQKERAFLCLAAHVANATPDPVPVHAEIALRAGATADELRAVMAYACASASAPPEGARAARDALERFLASTQI
jgi:4-carboxymuconolactone decarboxylase